MKILKTKWLCNYHSVKNHANDTPPERLKSLRIKNHRYDNAKKSQHQLTFESRFERGSFAHDSPIGTIRIAVLQRFAAV